jgi:hypothetical protein
MWKVCLALVWLFVATTLGGAAFAQGDTSTTIAETLFLEGRKLLDEGKYPQACLKFAESQRLDPNTATLLNLGHCHQQAGNTASAWIAFREAASLARRENLPERAETAVTRAAELEQSLAKLTISLAASGASLRITLDDTPVGRGALGVPIPMDPGPHTIVASAEGKQTWTKTIHIESEGQHVVEIPALADVEVSVEPAPLGTASGAPDVDEGDGSGQRIAGWIILGFGAASLTAAAVVGGVLLSKKDVIDEHCVESACDAEGFAVAKDVGVLDVVGTSGLVVGVAAAAVGLVLLLTAPDGDQPEKTESSLRVLPVISADTAGASFVLTW